MEQVEQATAAPGEKRDVGRCEWVIPGSTSRCGRPAGHDGNHTIYGGLIGGEAHHVDEWHFDDAGEWQVAQ